MNDRANLLNLSRVRCAPRRPAASLCLIAALCAGALPSTAQDQAKDQPKEPAKEPAKQPAKPGTMTLEQLPPPVRLGARATLMRRSFPVADAVVLVSNDASFAAAIASWTPTLRYPVLVDDGTAEAAERIALFVRAFKPAKVFTWEAPGATFPAEAPARFTLMQKIIAQSLGTTEADAGKPDALDAVLTKLADKATPPPGVVVVDAADASWAPALALAAGRAQPIALYRYPYGPIGSVPLKDAEAIDALVGATADRLKLKWKDLGDEIDAITICANIPTKADTTTSGDFTSLTDRVGRDQTNKTKRWAWTGQIYSRTTSEGVYNAMCSLFLLPDSAWFFNGYESGKGWSDYAPRQAAEAFNLVKLRTTLIEFPDGNERNWRAKAREGVDASMIFVNTMGNADFFNLRPGQCKPGDVPILKQPAAVYFIHSWSMTGPASRDTVGGRWLDRGAFAYFGSVQEPALGAFLTPAIFSIRFLSGAPWGTVFANEYRLIEGFGAAGKVGCVGDPLYAFSGPFGPEPARIKTDPAPGGNDAPVKPLDTLMREALKAQDLGTAARYLALMGREQDVSDLFTATVKDAPAKITPTFARAAIAACARSSNHAGVIRAFDALSPEDKKNGYFRDLLWFATNDSTAKPDSVTLGLLRDNVRPEQAARDATELGAIWSRVYNKSQAVTMIEQLRDKESNPDVKAQFEAALKTLK